MKNLYSALLRAQKRISGIGKDSRNTFHNYDYVSAETMIEDCRNALHEEGLVLTHDGDVNLEEPYKYEVMLGGKGEAPIHEQMQTGILLRQFILVHTESGEEKVFKWRMPIVPERGRPLDKAIATALTSGLSYFLRDLLMVPRKLAKEDNMDERHDGKETPPAQRAVVPKAEPAKKATKKAQLKAALEAWSVPSDEIHAAVLSIREHLEKSGVAKIGEAGEKGFTEEQCGKMLDWVEASQKEGLSFADAMA